MVDIVRRKNASFVSPDVSSADKAKAQMYSEIGSAISTVGKLYDEAQEKSFKDKLSQLENQQKAEKKAYDTQKKAYDASDKLIATDRAGQLKNDLLRWNMEKRQSNPTYIGSREHESDMRAEYSRLAEMYGKGLGEVGTAEFTTKTQGYVNQFAENDIKWAYQQKLKQGEESAKKIADSMNQTAQMYGASGDIQGFKESYSENREKLADYASKAMSPDNAYQALIETDKKSILNFLGGVSKNNPSLAKALLESPEMFAEVVPDEMIQTTNERLFKQEQRNLKEQMILANAGIANTKDKKEKRKLEKLKDELEDKIKENEKKDFTEESLKEIYGDLKKSISPQIQKQYELNELAEKQAKEQLILDMYKTSLNPDIAVSGNARLALRTQPSEVGTEMHKLYKEYIKTDQNVIKDTQPTLQGTIGAIELINNFVQPTDETELKKVESALKTNIELHNQPVTQEQYQQGNKIIYNSISDPDYMSQMQHTMALAKANVLDHYADLFSTDVIDTDKELQKPESTTPATSGIMIDFKTKKVVDFNYAVASEKNKAKYNLVKDTYAGVLNDVSIGKFEDANKKIFELPYNVAYINYEGKMSPDVLKKFAEYDRSGGDTVSFMYNGYSFEYLGIDQTGTIKAKRRL